MPPAVRIRCSPEIASVEVPVVRPGVTPSMVDGLPALPMPTILPSRMPTSAFTTPEIASTIVTLVMTRSRQPGFAGQQVVRAHAVAQRLAAAVLQLVAVDGAQILLDLDVEIGVAEPDLVADRRAVEVGVLAAGHLCHVGALRRG